MKHIISKPVITEKSLSLASRGWYTFAVAVACSKPEIASAIHDVYGVTVVDVRTLIIPGHERRSGKRMKRVRRSDWKKAIVKLKEGQKIEAFEETGEEGKK
ncbi:50S ribosomal protein L23 [Candidatus Gottesmanbacteria bacterium]|nr:50S ribosomal protein L23 [Candidatus Gottesmanbacteria bacterium]MBI3559698.1 50S ribosomal protein L23 [Candidatus Gottesmanbacteria bacterium]